MNNLPQTTLWAWERSEDLRQIDPATTAIAYLDQTIQLGQAIQLDSAEVRSQPRLHPLAYPTGTQRIAVVRIEIRPGTPLSPHSEEQTVALLLRSANLPSLAAFQVDFDATLSQRAFYRAVLNQLRRQMTAQLPLSITALASWCSYDDWLANLPIDEAVPMLFRMEPERRRASPSTPDLQIREPLCQNSLGLSTREPWPDNITGKRLYIFPDQGWHRDLPLAAHLAAQRNLP